MGTTRETFPASGAAENLDQLDPAALGVDGHRLTGEDPTADNTLRAGWAAEAVLTLARRTGLLSDRNVETVSTGIGDLLVNLAHLCDAADLDPELMFSTALEDYRCELGGE